MYVTTSGLLSFEDCERVLRDDLMSENRVGVTQKREECVLLLSEIPVEREIVLGEYFVRPLKRRRPEPFKAHCLVLHVPPTHEHLEAVLVGEIFCALLAFSFRRRFACSRERVSCDIADDEHINEFQTSRLPFVSVGPEGLLQIPLMPDDHEQRTQRLRHLFTMLLKIDSDDYLHVVRAIHLYQQALLTYRQDVGLAYSLLVASAETMAHRFVPKKTIQTDFTLVPGYQGWLKLFEKLKLSEPQREVIQEQLLRREEFLSLRFRQFISDNLPDSFFTSLNSRAWETDRWIESLSPLRRSFVDSLKETYKGDLNKLREHLGHIMNKDSLDRLLDAVEGKLQLSFQEQQEYEHVMRYWSLYSRDRKAGRNELDSILRRIYDVRSSFVHMGRSPSRNAVDSYETAEMRLLWDDAKKQVKFVRTLPTFHWFERAVSESTWNFLYR